MFQRKELIDNPFSKDKVINWLTRLGKGMKKQSQSVFMVEELQPIWLNTIGQRLAYGTVATLIVSFIFWMNLGLIFGLIPGLKEGLRVVLTFGMFCGLIGGIGVGSSKVIRPVDNWIWQRKNPRIGLIDIPNLIATLLYFLFWGQLAAIFVFLADLLLVRFSLPPVLLWGRNWLFSVMHLGIAFNLVFVLLGWLFFGYIAKIKKHRAKVNISLPNQLNNSLPNRGIHLSLKNAVLSFSITGIIFGLILFSFDMIDIRWVLIMFLFKLAPEDAGWNVVRQNSWLIGTLTLGLIGGLYLGGSAVIKHYSLRFILWIKGYTPFNFVKFLDHCAKLIFLKKVGGGYMFIHRMLLEHFAKMEIKSTRTKKSK